MASSRTGTTAWLKAARMALHLAQARGQTQCPYCSITLNYENKRTPNGAWVDHVTPYSKGGTNEQSNLVVCCRTCNISKGNRQAPKVKTVLAAKPLKTSRKW